MGGRLIRIDVYPKFFIFRLRCEDSVGLLCSVTLCCRVYQHDAVLAVVEVISDDHLMPISLERLLGFRYQKFLISFELREMWSYVGQKGDTGPP